MPRRGDVVRRRLQQAALELFTEQGFDQTSVEAIASRAGVTERTAYRHFADKREMLFDGERELREALVQAVAAVPHGTKPLPALRAAFYATVPLWERNRPFSEPTARLIAATPALRERSLTKNANLADALTGALRARGVDARTAPLCAQVAIDTLVIAMRRWTDEPSVSLHDQIEQAFRELRLAAAALK
ncbi:MULTISPECIES: TetR/AcrR family transcriptional regulator [unclassified Streptomyces]|uniref:TetR/AcrR family transcriptional regulator n=1 Tax=unclassified Streptomyces TaxID=2593676 RepID=UPI000F6D0477|nr:MULTISPECIES: TetR/AcrR family transcriptional regulator [unclassified Streptomyces]AZM62349.1 TetR family transcriptional regulator [Streptomyces sp. WAC 01438]RSM93624.1 TetR family transcriptional regulator [Streptomyces sp. WAC 01420]